ncbi:MAG: hypothetical protein JNM63_10760 [Spirochaetia bacterium]|nr:hypothetical protein [Spirochaetia bacterium]
MPGSPLFRSIACLIYFGAVAISGSLCAALEDLSVLNAHGVGLGGAVLTLGNDGNAVVGNPALLATQPLFTLGVTSHLEGVELASESIFSATLQGVVPLGAVGGIGLAMTSVLNTMAEGGVPRILFADHQVNLGYGLSIAKVFQVGASLHARGVYVDPHLSGLGDIQNPLELNATAGLFLAPIPYVAFALVVSRFFSSPGVHLAAGTRNPLFLGEVGLEYLFLEKQFGLAMGVEKYFLNNILRVSLGMRISGASPDVCPGAGIGLRLGRFTVDYAFFYPVSGVLKAGSHIATVGVQL